MSRQPRVSPCRLGPVVTDHALVRFLSRSGMDVESVRGAIEDALSAAHGAAIALGGADHMITVDGLSFVVREGKVTTVLSRSSTHDHGRALEPRIR